MERIKRRENGLTVIYEQTGAPTTALALFFRTGAYYEKPKDGGISLFTAEHLRRAVSSCRFPVSVSAARDHVSFFTESPSEELADAAAELLRLTDSPAFRDEHTEEIKRALTERISRYEPTEEESEEAVYFGTLVLPPVYGTADSVRKLTTEKAAKWRDKYFIPQNACLVMTGGFSESALRETLALSGGIPARSGKPSDLSVFPPEQFFRTSASDRVIFTETGDAEITLLFEADLCEIQTPYADMLCRLLQNRMRARQMKTPVRCGIDLRKDTGLITLRWKISPAQAASSIRTAADILYNVKEDPQPDDMTAFTEIYKDNLLYKYKEGISHAREIGLQKFIFRSDDVLLPAERDSDLLAEKLAEAADLILLPDNAVFTVRCGADSGIPEAQIRESFAYARVRLFIS